MCRTPGSLTLGENGKQWVLEMLFGLFHLLFMLGLLVHQAPHVAVGWLDHGVEVIGSAPVHLTPFYPCEQYCYHLTELAIIWGKSERYYIWFKFPRCISVQIVLFTFLWYTWNIWLCINYLSYFNVLMKPLIWHMHRLKRLSHFIYAIHYYILNFYSNFVIVIC